VRLTDRDGSFCNHLDLDDTLASPPGSWRPAAAFSLSASPAWNSRQTCGRPRLGPRRTRSLTDPSIPPRRLAETRSRHLPCQSGIPALPGGIIASANPPPGRPPPPSRRRLFCRYNPLWTSPVYLTAPAPGHPAGNPKRLTPTPRDTNPRPDPGMVRTCQVNFGGGHSVPATRSARAHIARASCNPPYRKRSIWGFGVMIALVRALP